MAKEITFEPMEKMLIGFDKAANAVVGTLGPCGRNVYIDDPLAPKITNDGATIAKNILLEDKVENMGANLIRNTSCQTNDDAGDGTTTTATLLQAIVHECIKRPENPMKVRESLKQALPKVIDSLKSQSVKITKKDVKRVALISAENEELATVVSDLINKIGEEAVITVEDSRTSQIETEIVDGYQAHVGFMSNHFITDPKKARSIFEDVPVVVSEKKISAIQDITPMFNYFKNKGITQAVIVCDDIENSILGMLVANKAMGTFNPLVIRATGPVLEDIEAAVGATRISDVTGVTFQNFDASFIGHAKKVISDSNKTIFIPENTEGSIAYSNKLQAQAEVEDNMYYKERLLKRVSQLRGGIAVIKVGAATDFAREYLKDKAEDAVKAAKAALQEGIVEGGGMALWRISSGIKPKTIGEEILKKALTAPLRKIIENAGKDYAEIIRNMPEEYGYDAKLDKYMPMIESGIIDPTKVERCALENAVSSAGEFITAFATITDYVSPNTK